MNKTTLAFTLLLAALPAVAMAASLCQPASANPAAHALLAAAQRHLADQPAPLPHVHTEGTLPNHGIREQSLVAEKDWPLMRQAALAWRISGDPRYLRQVDDYLAAWADVYQPDFNPIDETNLDMLITAYALTADHLRLETRAASRRLISKLGNGYIAHIEQFHGQKKGTQTNNWQSHRIKLVTLAAAALNDQAMLEHAHQLFKQQVADNILPDGSVTDFQDRDALHYVAYDLEPLVQAALAAKAYGGDWLNLKSNGASLGAALDWLVPYATGQRSHQEFVHTHVQFDKDRATVGEAGYSGTWDAKSSATLFWLAAQLDKRYLPVATQLAAHPADWISACYLK
ncbi:MULTISPECIES: alginate lyase family protein [unclassified Pseudomonas]|uniref:alginate lyase family protein n=1 Tax=unclassified Pseudomonas TaxID=196821 RepID=UPI001F38DFAA|nr:MULTISPECIES: alginate lyase family protein [unclassified Pseudomonas]MCF5232467.1 alginate lyase [Pseudomonas sp. PA-5-4H]MCF5238886.1 alginate lyase [Pseudomonas sp. PA-5-4G]MCF5250964.1 alginate lyase [Pseudomonas sp. PA-5-4B]MCF5254101.1 alginate lyase [Pseudomonas sp. PA-5-4B]MCF5261014.1 alginate lyase [Pseudomonas sp. PA-5-4A]